MLDLEEFLREFPGELALYCDCGYESPAFCFDDTAYGCRNCHAVVFPQPLPFVYEPPNCDQCNHALDTADRIHAGKQPVLCPHCQVRTMHIRRYQIQFLSNEVMDQVPTPGQRLHGEVFAFPYRERMIRVLNSPYMLSDLRFNVTVTNRPWETMPLGKHEFRTVRADDAHLIVEHVRALKIEEWKWYFR